MKVLGLTGSIGMGKSTAAATFRRLRIPVFDADATVHQLQGPGGAAVRPIEAAFPGTTRSGRVDRAALRAVVLADPAARKRLEAIVWPLVRRAERTFLAAARRRGERIAVLDIPLLLETGGQARVDQVIVVSAPPAVQRVRVLARGTMSPAQFAAIRAAQMPDAAKRRKADHVVRTGLSKHAAQRHIRAIVRELRATMRQIVLDTETTGFDPASGDRVLEVAAIELFNFIPTGGTFHRVVDPERDVPEEATRVHGFTAEMLRGKPLFADIADELMGFLGSSEIIAHNAPFDFGFLDAELVRAGRPKLDRARMVDSLDIAKRRYPGMPNSLDALCRRLGVDNSMRTSHNALLDVKLLAEVFLQLMGGKQPGLELAATPARRTGPALAEGEAPPARTPRPIAPSDAELAAHAAFVAKKLKEPLWLQPPFAPPAEPQG